MTSQHTSSQVPTQAQGNPSNENRLAGNPKKRRAAFGDITNDGKSVAGNKKKVMKKDQALQQNLTKKEIITKALRIKPKKTLQVNEKPVPIKEDPVPIKEESDLLKVNSVPIKEEPKPVKDKLPVKEEPKCSIPTVLQIKQESPPVKEEATDAIQEVSVIKEEPDDYVQDSQASSESGMEIDIPSSSDSSITVGESSQQEEMKVVEKVIEVCEQLSWIDIDKENENQPYYVTEYVNDIFAYYKEREAVFVVSDYMSNQTEVTATMRAILVDWMSEVQQNFELNHETLYLAVKLIDIYLAKTNIVKDQLQLLGATALSIASKFEERCPPALDDYLFICDDAYARNEILDMERTMLMAVGFDLGIPLSYTFLRRYAQCGRVSIQTLTCARYILEMSLMEYCYVECSESKMAAVCLLLAMEMNHDGQWDDTMIHYTSYCVDDLASLARTVNAMLVSPPHKTLTTIKNKYLHEVFHEVARKSPLTETDIQRLLCASSNKSAA